MTHVLLQSTNGLFGQQYKHDMMMSAATKVSRRSSEGPFPIFLLPLSVCLTLGPFSHSACALPFAAGTPAVGGDEIVQSRAVAGPATATAPSYAEDTPPSRCS